MAEDFYNDDFYYGYGSGESDQYGGTPDYAPGYEDISYAPYEQSWGLESPAFESFSDSPFGGDGDLFGAYYDYYLGLGLDPMQALSYAAEDASSGSIQSFTEEAAPLPDISWPLYGLPYVPNYDYGQYSPYIPVFSDLPTPAPPLQTSPAIQQPNLPTACPGGYYHPYPIGHPDQNKCVPFPPQATPAPPQQSSSSGGSQAPKPPQQQCPKGYYRDPATGQCKPIPQGQPQSCPSGYYRAPTGQCLPIPKCTTPGTVFDQARGICVPQGQAVAPLSEGLFDGLSKLPWWIWLALGGLLLLSRDDGDGKKTTVTYRRAR
jgi:hypothetical protein